MNDNNIKPSPNWVVGGDFRYFHMGHALLFLSMAIDHPLPDNASVTSPGD